MKQINELVQYFQNISQEKLWDILIAIVIVIIFTAFSSMMAYFIIKLFMRKEKNKEIIKSNAFYHPIKIFLIFLGLYLAIYILDLPAGFMEIWRKLFKIAVICIVAKGMINLTNPKSELAKKLHKKDLNRQEETMQRFGGRIFKYVVYIVAVFLVLKELGYDISGLITGLGIVSAVVALAAQDFVKSLLSGMSIASEKPFLVGDWIEVGNISGTVIDISFRTTKIKTNDNTIVTIENAVITSSPVVNWARMGQRRYEFDLRLPLEINQDKIESVISRIKFVLKNIETVDPDSINVNFNSILEDGININIYLYTTTVDYAEYLAFRQKVNEQVLKILEAEDVKLIYPTQNICVADIEKAK